jgi:poly(A) polymerase
MLLGKPEPNDLDIVTERDAVALAKFLFEKQTSTIAPVLYPRFGTAMVRVHSSAIELITARRESYTDDSRKPRVQPATLKEDALRRDFTVNTLLQNIHTGELRDPLGVGLEDLKAKVLRTPVDAAAIFFDDPLRMLRTVRFRWQLGFEPLPGLYDAARQEAHRLGIISAERIRDEWTKMLLNPHRDRAMQDLMDLRLLHEFAPEFERMVGVDQGSFHHLDVWEHSLLVLKNSPPGDLTLALAALLHDVGKPPTRFIDEEGDTRFFGHEGVGADMARKMLQRLKFANEQIDAVVLLVKNHMRLGSAPIFTPAAARRLLRDMDGQVERLLELVEADVASLRPGVRALDLHPIRERLASVTVATPRSTLESPLSGQEIMDLTGLPPGPEIGRIKNLLVERVIEGELQPGDKEAAVQMVKDEARTA